MLNAFSRWFALAVLFSPLFSCHSDAPVTGTTALTQPTATTAAPKRTAQDVLLLLPDSFFTSLQARDEQAHALIASREARQQLLAQYPIVHENCLSQRLEPEVLRSGTKKEYQEFEQYNELNFSVYAFEKGDFVVYLQIVKVCKGICDKHKEETLLQLCKRYNSKSKTWTEYRPELERVARQLFEDGLPTRYVVTPQGLCQKEAVEQFEKTRHRSANSQMDIARVAWESDACLVWTGKGFE